MIKFQFWEVGQKWNSIMRFLLGIGLKEPKISSKIVKVGFHTYHRNAHQKKWLNFNSKKFVKSETPLHGFTKLGVKGGENSLECDESWSACLSIKWASKSMIKFQLREKLSKAKLCRAFSLEFGLKQVQKAWKIAKFGGHTCISTGHLNLWSNFTSGNLVKTETPSCGFAKVWLKGGKKRSEHH